MATEKPKPIHESHQGGFRGEFSLLLAERRPTILWPTFSFVLFFLSQYFACSWGIRFWLKDRYLGILLCLFFLFLFLYLCLYLYLYLFIFISVPSTDRQASYNSSVWQLTSSIKSKPHKPFLFLIMIIIIIIIMFNQITSCYSQPHKPFLFFYRHNFPGSL